MHAALAFRLVLCADVSDCAEKYAIEMLERFLEGEKMEGGLDYLRYEPLIISDARTPRTRPYDGRAGNLRRPVLASAL